jgi:hypothetical protein
MTRWAPPLAKGQADDAARRMSMMRQAWPFLTAERPVIVDWLPWSAHYRPVDAQNAPFGAE